MSTIGRPLNARQAAFVEAFLTRGRGFLCATRAAAIAGYKWPGKQGPRLLWRPHVHARIEARFVLTLDPPRL